MWRRCFLWLPRCFKIMTLMIDCHRWEEYWFLMAALRRSTCHWISCPRCASSTVYSGDSGKRSCFATRGLLWVRWKPDVEVDVDSGQAEIYRSTQWKSGCPGFGQAKLVISCVAEAHFNVWWQKGSFKDKFRCIG